MEAVVFIPAKGIEDALVGAFDVVTGDQLAVTFLSDKAETGPYLLTEEETETILNIVVEVARRMTGKSLPSYAEFVQGAEFPVDA